MHDNLSEQAWAAGPRGAGAEIATALSDQRFAAAAARVIERDRELLERLSSQ